MIDTTVATIITTRIDAIVAIIITTSINPIANTMRQLWLLASRFSLRPFSLRYIKLSFGMVRINHKAASQKTAKETNQPECPGTQPPSKPSPQFQFLHPVSNI
jgi:hypothetical protein